jgi:predicted amidohydrolase
MRTQTVRRLRERVDVVMAGSGWWSVPQWAPGSVFRRWESDNETTARTAAATFARYVGAPVVHAAHAGTLECAMPWMPVRYRGHFEGATLITDADGTVLAERNWRDGEGIVLADVSLGRKQPSLAASRGFWLHRRGPMATMAWNYQRWHGRRWYRDNIQAG